MSKQKIKSVFIKIEWFLSSQLGLNLRIFFLALRGVPKFLYDLFLFRRTYEGRMGLMPCLHDWYEEAGVTKSEYFWQDLFVSQLVNLANPERHVDVGSRIDGFVAHIASFRDCEVFDVRPIDATIPRITFRQANVMDSESLPANLSAGYCDSLSCLHAIEHFGLGRYGDPLSPKGYQFGIYNMVKLLRRNGVFYLSAPIGVERVEFNAHRVFDPREIVLVTINAGMSLQKLFVIDPTHGPEPVPIDADAIARLASHNYQLGLFVFKKV